MALSQLTFVIKTNHCIQQETSITLKCYSAGDVNLFSSTVYTEIRSIEVFHVLSFSEFIGKRHISHFIKFKVFKNNSKQVFI